MRLLVLGATGKLGLACLKEAKRRSHDVLCVVPDKSVFETALAKYGLTDVVVVQGDCLDRDFVLKYMGRVDCVLNCLKQDRNTSVFSENFKKTAEWTEEAMGTSARYWCVGRSSVLEVPMRGLKALDLPCMPASCRVHKENYEMLRRSELDFSMLCAGPMSVAENGKARANLRVCADVWPFDYVTSIGWLPRIGLLIKYALSRHKMAITYEDAAFVICSNLSPKGPFGRKRVGIARPKVKNKPKDI